MQLSGQTTTTTYETEAGNVAQLITTSLLSLYQSSIPPSETNPLFSSWQQMACTPSFLVSLLFLALFGLSSSANFYKDVNPIFGGQRCKIVGNGNLLTLSLDRASGSGFQSKREYLFGRVDMQMKLVPGNSAGTVTTLYLSSQGPTHDEVDFEFLGNSSGDPYVFHTNIFTQGKGNREQRFYLWFDPRLHFHTYSILWNQKNIILLVDGTPVRGFRNAESIGVPYPKNQPMRLYSTLWNADDWATRGGLVKTDWSKAPFVASYRAFSADACIWSGRPFSCSEDTSKYRWGDGLDASGRRKLNWVRRNYMFYNYCKDTARFPKGVPRECYLSPKRERERERA